MSLFNVCRDFAVGKYSVKFVKILGYSMFILDKWKSLVYIVSFNNVDSRFEEYWF